MKYELIKTDISQELPVLVDVFDEENNFIGQEIDETKYKVNITLGIHPTDGVAPDFSKDIEMVSDNSKTGFEVDTQREQAINDFMSSIN